MMSKKLIWAMAGVLVLAVVLIIAGQSEGQTHPTWVGKDLASGTTDVTSDGTTPSPGPLSYIECVESASWVGSLWGISPVSGDTIRICPMYGAGTDTTIEMVSGSGFKSTGTGILEIRTVSGTATFWGE